MGAFFFWNLTVELWPFGRVSFSLSQMMLNLNKRLGRITNDNSISITSRILIPDVCYGALRPTRCAGEFPISANFQLTVFFAPRLTAVDDCTNGNGNDVCPMSTSTCNDTDASFECACKPGLVPSPDEVCSTRIPGDAVNNHCTKSCMPNPCLPNPCTGGTCTVNGTGIACGCPTGTRLNGTACVSLCNGINCGVGSAGCTNGECSCRPGYQPTADKTTCIDRCSVAGAVPCSGPLSVCVAGTCTCSGRSVLRSGGVCESTACDSSFVCNGGQCVEEENNRRVCLCPFGTKLDASNTCVDIDECAEGADKCVVPARCVNHNGAAYTCSCDKHNMMHGTNLVLVNKFECGKPCPKNCNGAGTCNTDGTCNCKAGFVRDVDSGCRSPSSNSTAVEINSPSGDPNIAAIVGGIIGVLALLIIVVILLAVRVCRTRKTKEATEESAEVPMRAYRDVGHYCLLPSGQPCQCQPAAVLVPKYTQQAQPKPKGGPYGMYPVPLHSDQYIILSEPGSASPHHSVSGSQHSSDSTTLTTFTDNSTSDQKSDQPVPSAYQFQFQEMIVDE